MTTLFMENTFVRELQETEDLLREIQSWTEEELDELPKLYREKARELRQLGNEGD